MRELLSCEILTDSEPKISQTFQRSLFLRFFAQLSTVLLLYQNKQMGYFVKGGKNLKCIYSFVCH